MNFSRNQFITIIIGAIIIALAFFFIGKAAGKSGAPAGGPGAYGAGRSGMGGGRTRGAGFAAGTVLSQDATSITISLRGGGSQIILISPSTAILKTIPGSASDLKTGDNVMINGSAQADGSIAAQTVSIRPADQTPPPAQTQSAQ